ncbi:hypothetical protein HanRHA438_Chr09g0418531 [Helianthus annuus]|nr:hypothetical protein HanRHA438_Chr09g0418531 [Helianthus annuus]
MSKILIHKIRYAFTYFSSSFFRFDSKTSASRSRVKAYKHKEMKYIMHFTPRNTYIL